MLRIQKSKIFLILDLKYFHRCKVDEKDDNNCTGVWTPLQIACYNGYYKIVAILLADPRTIVGKCAQKTISKLMNFFII